MSLTPDDVISMHKVAESVVTAMSQDSGLYIETDDLCARRDEAIRDAVRDLAVVQRDLLAAMLGK